MILSILSSATLTLKPMDHSRGYACSPPEFFEPILLTQLDADFRLPSGASLMFEGDYQLRDVEPVVTLNGEVIDVTVETKPLLLTLMMYISLPADMPVGAELTVHFNGLMSLEEMGDVSKSYEIGEPLPASSVMLEQANFDLIKLSDGIFDSCDPVGYATNFTIRGEGLDAEWVYIDAGINDDDLSRLISFNIESTPELATVYVKHGRDDDEVSLSSEARTLTLFDHYGRAHTVDVSGACRLLNESSNGLDFEEVERNSESCELLDEPEVVDPEEDPEDTEVVDPEEDPEDTEVVDPEEDPEETEVTDPEPEVSDPDPENPEVTDPSSQEEVEESGGCDQSNSARSELNSPFTLLFVLFGLLGIQRRKLEA